MFEPLGLEAADLFGTDDGPGKRSNKEQYKSGKAKTSVTNRGERKGTYNSHRQTSTKKEVQIGSQRTTASGNGQYQRVRREEYFT